MIITKALILQNSSEIKNVFSYITNPEKTLVLPEDYPLINAFGPVSSTEHNLPSGDYSRMIQWDDHGSCTCLYVSAHLCQLDNVPADFLATAACSSSMQGKSLSGPLAYQFVQSLDDTSRLADEAVHQIGLKLCERELREFPFVIASHVHSIKDKDGSVRGLQQHNHILLCAYKAPEFCLSEGAVKLNRSHEFEDQLRITNDRLAIEYDLPIIRDPDMHRTRSWYDAKMAEKGLSLKNRTRQIIETTRDQSRNWYEFVRRMAEAGYVVKEDPALIYEAPGGTPVYAKSLGHEYTKGAIIDYLLVKRELQSLVQDLTQAQEPPPLRTLMDRYGPLYVDVPIGIPRQGREHYQPISLRKSRSESSIQSYFDPLRWYNVKDRNGKFVTKISGHYVIEYLTAVRYNELPTWATTAKPSPNAILWRDGYWYVGANFQRNTPFERYRVCWYNEDGSKRSILEIILRLIAVTLLGERVYRQDLPPYRKPLFDEQTRAELRRISETLRFVQEEHVETIRDLFRLQDDALEKIADINQQLENLNRGLPANEATILLQQKRALRRRVARLEQAITYTQTGDLYCVVNNAFIPTYADETASSSPESPSQKQPLSVPSNQTVPEAQPASSPSISDEGNHVSDNIQPTDSNMTQEIDSHSLTVSAPIEDVTKPFSDSNTQEQLPIEQPEQPAPKAQFASSPSFSDKGNHVSDNIQPTDDNIPKKTASLFLTHPTPTEDVSEPLSEPNAPKQGSIERSAPTSEDKYFSWPSSMSDEPDAAMDDTQLTDDAGFEEPPALTHLALNDLIQQASAKTRNRASQKDTRQRYTRDR